MTGSKARFIEAKHKIMDDYSTAYIRLLKLKRDFENGQAEEEAKIFQVGYTDALGNVLLNVFGMTEEELSVLDDQAIHWFHEEE